MLTAAIVLSAMAGRALAAADVPVATPGEVETAPVRFDGRTLMQVAGISSRPAEDRGRAIAERIEAMAADEAAETADIGILPLPQWLEIRAPAYPLMLVTAADAALEGAPVEVVAAAHRRQIVEAIERYRAERQPARLWRGVGVSLAAILALVAAIMLSGFLERRYGTLVQAGHGRVAATLRIAPVLKAMRGSLATGRLVAVGLLVLAWADVVLGQFPWTRWLSEDMASLLLDPVRAIAVRRFEPERSLATYKIIRVLVVGMVLVMANPNLPGVGSEALQGLSVFADLVLSLGASSSVANVFAGYITTFGRALRVGDIVRVGDVTGTVIQIRLLSVRLRTIRNEEVTIPNAVMVGANVVNYSTLSRDPGLVLQTEVGIGYETPWRQVHAMLLEAARRTQGLMGEPAPFVLQKQLGDFAEVYQLNVYKAEAVGLVHAYSRLHENVLDVFNEYGVQIMTTAYEGDPAEPKVVPKEQWLQAPAAPKEGEGGQT